MRIERIGGATLYLGDCREVLPNVSADALVTDPPYGVSLKGKATKHTINRPEHVYEDSPENFLEVVLPGVSLALERVKRGAVFCGTRQLMRYPHPADIGGIVCPNGGGMSSWGFGCYHPVLFYGKQPHKGARPTATSMYHPGMHVTGEDDNEHPCPKPVAFMEWLIGLASLPGETLLDPFAGSGTTGVAAASTGRAFIGIEIEPRYFDIACERITAAYAQQRLFA